MNDTNRTIIISHNARSSWKPRFDRVRNCERRIIFSHIFSRLEHRGYNYFLPTYFLDFFVFALLFWYFTSPIDIISFLPQQSGNRLSDSWLDKSYDSHSIEGEERKRAEYGCSNWTSECSISSVVKFFATRGKIGNKICDEYGASFTCPWKTALYSSYQFFSPF